MSRVFAIVLRQYYLMRGSFPRVLPTFMWVAMDVLLWGFMSKYLNSLTPDAHWTGSLLGAVLLWDFGCRVMLGVSTTFLEDVWSRNFLSVFASPISIAEYVGGLVLAATLTSAIGLVVMLVLAKCGFGFSFFSYGTLLPLYVAVLFTFGLALGIFISAVVFRVGPAGEWFVWPLPILLSPFAGIFYPVSVLPAWMRWLSHLLPPSYVFDSMREVARHQPHSAGPLLAGVALAMAYLAAAYAYFAHVQKHAVRTGLIARYSAESVA